MQRLESEQDGRECGNCGRHVTRSFARVFGTPDGTVERCRNCDTVGRLMAGSAAGKQLNPQTDPLVDTTRANESSGEPVLLSDIEGDA